MRLLILLVLTVTQTYTSPIDLEKTPDIRPFYAENATINPQDGIHTSTSPTDITLNLITDEDNPQTAKPNLESVSIALNERLGQPTPSSGGLKNHGSSESYPSTKNENPYSGTFLEFLYERTTAKPKQTTPDDSIYFPTEHPVVLADKFGSPTMKPVLPAVKEPSRIPSLVYVPIRPFYAPNPVVYPQPVYPTNKITTSGDDKQDMEPISGTTVPDLNYKPSRPPFAPNPIEYPQPVDQTNHGDVTTTLAPVTQAEEEVKEPEVTSGGPNKVPNLSYVPSRPPYAPNPVVYPQPVTDSNHNEHITSTTQKVTLLEEEKEEIGTTSGPSNVPNLSYVPSRPPYAPNPVVYPQPVTGSTQNEQTTQKVTVLEEEKEEIGTTSAPSNVPNLSYVPSRPPFAPNPVVYPQPVTGSTQNEQTTQKVILEEEKEEMGTTSSPNKVPNLSYVPSRPPYAPNPVVYPQPVIGSTQIEQTTQKVTVLEEEKEEIGTTSGPNKVPNLSYVPSRPPYAPNPVVYPQPVTDLNQKETTTTTTEKLEADIENEISSAPIDTSTVPNLNYVPSRPPYAPYPVVYPQPVAEKQELTTKTVEVLQESTTPVDLNYKPTRPPYYSSTVVPNSSTEEQEEVKPTTPSVEVAIINFYEDFIHNLELILEYVQKLQQQTRLTQKRVPPRQIVDLTRIAAAIKPLYNKLSVKNVE